MKLAKLTVLLFAVSLTAFASPAKPIEPPAPPSAAAPAVPSPEVIELRTAVQMIQRQRDDLAAQLLNTNVQVQLLQQKLQAALTPPPAPADANHKPEKK